jgi:hypothetical protein
MVGQVKLPPCRPCRPWWCRMSTSRFPAGAPVAMAARRSFELKIDEHGVRR